jgi:hypothetical protein
VTTLDELLERGSHDHSRPGRHHRPTRRGSLRLLIRTTVAAGALAAAVVVVAYGLGYHLWYPLVLVGLLALAVLHRAVAGLGAVAVADVELPAEVGDMPAADGFAEVLRRWQSRLSWEQAGLWRSSRTLHPHLVDLVDERLRQRHGIVRVDSPAAAREVLGEQLWSYVHRPPAHAPSPRKLSELLDDVDRI